MKNIIKTLALVTTGLVVGVVARRANEKAEENIKQTHGNTREYASNSTVITADGICIKLSSRND